LGYRTESVFGTNLIFSRSRNQKGAKYEERANICWNVHKEFIKIVDPKFMIVFGYSKISPYHFIKNNYKCNKEKQIESGHGNWKCFSCNVNLAGKERLIIALPHLSRYHITNHESVVNWIIAQMAYA